jgi:sulfatase modifying factor 1
MMKQRSSTNLGLFTMALCVVGLAQSAELTEQIYSRASEFSRLDLNSDGFIAADEYNGTEKLFAATDVDADGKLSPDEAIYMITFTEIPAGSFTMGTAGKEPTVTPVTDAGPEHDVFVEEFLIGTTEITTAQYAHYLNSALKTGQITVERANSGPGRIVYPLPIWTISGAPGTKYEGRAFNSLSPVSGLSHIRADGHPLLIPEHPLNQSWITYIPELEQFTVALGFEDWPAAFIKWYGAMAFAEYYGLTLPTEAEWEYAARGGHQFRFATHNGTIGCDVANYKCYNSQRRGGTYAGVDTPDEYVGHRVNVGSYPANPFGVFDLSGNVWEWCLDWYEEDFYQKSAKIGLVSNPLNLDGGQEPPSGTVVTGPGSAAGMGAGGMAAGGMGAGGMGAGDAGDTRVTRGGSYQYHETTTEAASRRGMMPSRGNDHWGFRVAIRSPSTVFNGTE